MPNDRLRDAMLQAGPHACGHGSTLGVDPKTVERWIDPGPQPVPASPALIAALLREGESYLWPNALTTERATQVAQSEVVHIYPRRGAVPPDLWQRLLDQANSQIGILAYAGLFLPEQNPRLGVDPAP